MVPYLPKQVSYRALLTYIPAVIVISIAFSRFSMPAIYLALGLAWVSGFFFLTNIWSKDWQSFSRSTVINRIFWIALIIRLIYVVASYFYYIQLTGIPFEFDTADALGYHEEAKWLASSPWHTAFNYYFDANATGISDVGYPIYLTCLYKLFGPNILLVRIIKAFLSAWTCVLVYNLCERTFGRDVARMAGIMMAIMPNFVIYCGYHLKETEMLFLEVAFLERTDYLFRSEKSTFLDIIVSTLLAGSLFFFRTLMGVVAFLAFATAAIFFKRRTMKKGWKRTAIISWLILLVFAMGGGVIATETEGYMVDLKTNSLAKRTEQTNRGNKWAQYATGAVMAPMIAALPFSTMIEVDNQYEQENLHGGNFIRNFMAFFFVIAIIEALKKKKWRDFTLIGAFTVAYLGVISMTGFSNSERYLLPALPCLITMWAYGLSELREKTFKWLTPWCFVVFAMEFAWAFFKLGSRGLL